MRAINHVLVDLFGSMLVFGLDFAGSINNVAIVGASSGDRSKWKRK